MTKRRNSQSHWYHNRGRVRVNISCEGSGSFPTEIAEPGDWHVDPATGKPKGKLPRGICGTCGDEMALNVLDSSGTPTVRKHKDPNAPYRRQILISEEAFRALYARHNKTGTPVEDLVDELIKDNYSDKSVRKGTKPKKV